MLSGRYTLSIVVLLQMRAVATGRYPEDVYMGGNVSFHSFTQFELLTTIVSLGI